MKYFSFLFGWVLLFTVVASPFDALAQTTPETDHVLYFFYSSTCPHCHAEHDFLDETIEPTYPSLEVKRYEIANTEHHELLFSLAKKTGAEQYLGTVPLTFIGNTYIVGFDNPDGIGVEIEQAIQHEFGLTQGVPESDQKQPTTSDGKLTFFGYSIDPSSLSLPTTAILLGIIDGFNVCSLGALILILGIVITLKSRRKIILYGGGFLLTSGIIYALLIFLWHQLFTYLAPFKLMMEIVLALLGIGGGLYFLKEYRRFKRYGVTCSGTESPFISNTSRWVRDLFQKRTSVLGLLGAIVAFATVLTIVEFPCSAAVPVMFAGILANADLSLLAYSGYIVLFVLFYLLDELIIFGIAVYRLHIWLMSPKFTVWAALIEGIALLSIGLYYAYSLMNAL